MLVIPAVDILSGKCVRLFKGRFDSSTVFSDDPVEAALRWSEMGAEWIHVVDLDGAREGEPRNLEVVSRIVEAVDVPIQFGGGVRSMGVIERLLELGVRRVILGTAALRRPDLVREACSRFGDAIAVSIDAKEGVVATDGWLRLSDRSAVELALEMERMGVRLIIYTDISRDGTLSGANVESIRRMAESVGVPLIASGGVSSIEDILKLKELEPLGVVGVIVGKALYTGAVDLREAIAAARSTTTPRPHRPPSSR